MAIAKLPRVERFYGTVAPYVSPPLAGWLAWQRPKSATMHMFLVVGGGAGGGGGLTGIAGSARGGGSGGSAGGIARLIVPSFLLPRELFLFVGTGSPGAVAGGNADQPTLSTICDRPNKYLTAANTLLVSGAAEGFGGSGGSVTGSDGGGLAPTIATNVTGIYQGIGIWMAIAGILGGSSGALGGAGPNLTYGASGTPLSAGGGGGSLNTSNVGGAGASITGAGRIATVAGGSSGTAGGNGQHGNHYEFPWLNTGGAGGGTGSTTTGGRGGNGAWGCGGGGGGGGITGGAGGDGGPGVIIIVSW